MNQYSFYDNTPFYYGFSSEEDILSNMNILLKRLIENNKNKVFCDIGCGCGRNLTYIVKFAYRAIGVDLSKESLNIAKKHLKGCNNLELLQGDNLDIPLPDNLADVVVSDGVCHHTGDTIGALYECIRILKPKGRLYLAVYKKYRYYPILYFILGGILRFINKYRIGKYILEFSFIRIHYFLYKIFKKQRLSLDETRNIFYDYFLTPIATFQSKKDVMDWLADKNVRLIEYNSTTGNCHVFIIEKNE